jgi:hypothetical protein
MSEMYEGVVIAAGADRVRGAFDALASPLTLRLTELARRLWRLARRRPHRPLAPEEVEAVGSALAAALAMPTLAVFYDSQVGLREAVLFDAVGAAAGVFGAEDEWWVPLDEDGEPVTTARGFRAAELDAQGEDFEFETAVSALDAGLDAVADADRVEPGVLKQAFAYEARGWIAERRPG